jgi:hypothetical protein
MPDLPFKDRMLLWWSATKLLMGSDAAPQVRRRLDAALSNRFPHDHAPSRWNAFCPTAGQGDGRRWLMHGHPGGAWRGSGATQRSIVVRALWDYASDFSKQAAHQRWSSRFKEAPQDICLATIDAWLSQDTTDNLSEIDLSNEKLNDSDLTWLGYWACASDDRELMGWLTLRRPLEKWEAIDQACSPWLGWCSLMGRGWWTEKAIEAGMEVNRAQTFRHGFVDKLVKLRREGFPEAALLASSAEATVAAVKKKFGANPMLGSGFNALRWATDVNSVEVMDALLYHGPNLYEQSKDNQTLLDLSIHRHAWTAAVSLASHGARLGMDDKEEFRALSYFALLSWSEHASDPSFVELGRLLVDRVAPLHPKQWNEKASAWADVLLCGASNKEVHPYFIAGVIKASKTPGHWQSWNRVTRRDGVPEKKESALDLAINASNGAFLSAVAGNAIDLDHEHLGSSLLSFLIWMTPAHLKPWLDKTTPAIFEDAWKHKNGQITRGKEVTLWNRGTTCFTLSVACEDPRTVLALLYSHPASSATLKAHSINSWASIAMKQERVEAVEAVKETIGIPTWGVGDVSSGWAHASQQPRNEAMINKVLEWGWPVNVAVDKSGLSLLRAVAEQGDASLVKRLAAHGADPDLDDDLGRGSLSDWLASQEDQASIAAVRRALAEGQAMWLSKSTVAPQNTLATTPQARRL